MADEFPTWLRITDKFQERNTALLDVFEQLGDTELTPAEAAIAQYVIGIADSTVQAVMALETAVRNALGEI